MSIRRANETAKIYLGEHLINDAGGTIVPKTITENGTYNASADSADGYSPVTVNVPQPKYKAIIGELQSKSTPQEFEIYTGSFTDAANLLEIVSSYWDFDSVSGGAYAWGDCGFRLRSGYNQIEYNANTLSGYYYSTAYTNGVYTIVKSANNLLCIFGNSITDSCAIYLGYGESYHTTTPARVKVSAMLNDASTRNYFTLTDGVFDSGVGDVYQNNATVYNGNASAYLPIVGGAHLVTAETLNIITNLQGRGQIDSFIALVELDGVEYYAYTRIIMSA